MLLHPARALGALLGLSMIVLGSRRAAADIFSYTDAQGVLHLTNKPRGDHRYRVFAKSPPSARQPKVTAVAPSDDSPDRVTRYATWIREAAELYQIPDALIHAIIKCESDYDPQAVSPAGALGLMQLMPATASRLEVRDAFDPREAIFGGTRYLRILSDLFDGDLQRVVAAYNAGEGAVARHDGIPPYEETQRYVTRVLGYYERYRTAKGAGETAST
ncbi:Membrane-bound lytic murein transglycosylase D precursor [Minicystis rosea]|nr:Membrane-bound lytic murein transglycosylase D precursor [Minicystis rosea]